MAETYQILVVDDDFSIVNIIETALKQAGYQVLTAHDGEAACHRLASRRFVHPDQEQEEIVKFKQPHIAMCGC